MLDRIADMRGLDRSNMLETISRFPQLVESGCEAASKIELGFDSCSGGIRFLGVGGSAIGGDIIRDWLGKDIPGGVMVERGFGLSGPLIEDSLVICCSYGGNTSETLSMLDQVLKSKAKKVLLISSNGELAEVAKKKCIPLIKLEKVPMPRASLPLVFSSVATICDRIGLTRKSTSSMLDALVSCRKFIREEIGAEVPTERNPAKKIAHTIHGFVPIAISPVTIESIARRWKTQLNENSKQHCFFGTFPEISHNEIVPWLRDERSQVFIAMLLQDLCEDAKLRKGFDRFSKALIGSVKTIDVQACGKSRIEVLMNHILCADFASVYSAFLSGLDPTPVDEIISFKGQ